jgi:hypothetical protein
VGLQVRKNQAIGIVAAIALVLLIVWYGFQRVNRQPLSEREIATRVMAEYVGKAAKPRAVLVVSNPYAQMASVTAEAYRFQKAGEAGLREGFARDVQVKVGFAKLKPEAIRDVTSVFVPPNSTTPLSYLVGDSAFDDLVREHPDCDVLVSFIGLPANTLSSGFWLKTGPPQVALLLPDFSVVGDPVTIRHAFKTGKLVAAVIAKPGAPPQKTVGSNYKAEFDKRFLLITAENIDQFLPILLR